VQRFSRDDCAGDWSFLFRCRAGALVHWWCKTGAEHIAEVQRWRYRVAEMKVLGRC
jgi:hypothetical protein